MSDKYLGSLPMFVEDYIFDPETERWHPDALARIELELDLAFQSAFNHDHEALSKYEGCVYLGVQWFKAAMLADTLNPVSHSKALWREWVSDKADEFYRRVSNDMLDLLGYSDPIGCHTEPVMQFMRSCIWHIDDLPDPD